MAKGYFKVGQYIVANWDEGAITEVNDDTVKIKRRFNGEIVEINMKDIGVVHSKDSSVIWDCDEKLAFYCTIKSYEYEWEDYDWDGPVEHSAYVDVEIEDGMLCDYFKEKKPELYEQYMNWTFEETIDWLQDEKVLDDIAEWYCETHDVLRDYGRYYD